MERFLAAEDSSIQDKAIASLLTAHGPMLIFTSDALIALVGSMRRYCEGGAAEVAAECNDKLDGFTLAEWAAFACKKAAIASFVARLNGELKSKLASASSRGELFYIDPWAESAKSGNYELKTRIATSAADPVDMIDPLLASTCHNSKARELPSDGVDAWSKWTPITSMEKFKGKRDVWGKKAKNEGFFKNDLDCGCKGSGRLIKVERAGQNDASRKGAGVTDMVATGMNEVASTNES